jgi:hypothetical protein
MSIKDAPNAPTSDVHTANPLVMLTVGNFK